MTWKLGKVCNTLWTSAVRECEEIYIAPHTSYDSCNCDFHKVEHVLKSSFFERSSFGQYFQSDCALCLFFSLLNGGSSA